MSSIPKYQRIINERVKRAFPLSAYGARNGLRKQVRQMLDKVSSLASSRVVRLGRDGLPASAFSIPESGNSPERVIDQLVGQFEGLPNWAQAGVMVNLMPPTTSGGALAHFLTALLNPDACSSEFSGKRIMQVEKQLVTVFSRLMGFPETTFGFFTYGGSAGIKYGLLQGLERAYPGRFERGQLPGAVILASERAHFATRCAAVELGIGARNVVSVRADENDGLRVDDLEKKIRQVLASGRQPACLVATLGTTDTFGLDNLGEIHTVLKHFNRPLYVHADAVVSWAWSFFADYDFTTNPLQFNPETLKALQSIVKHLRYLPLADSVSINPHKFGYVPIPASVVLFKNNGVMERQRSVLKMPQLYQQEEIHSLEATRYAGGILATQATLSLLGKEGYQSMLGRVIEMGLYLRRRLLGIEGVKLINPEALGPGTLFYVEGKDSKKIYDYFMAQVEEERVLISTALRDKKIVLKSLIISPFTDEESIDRFCRLLSRSLRSVD